VGRLGSRVWVSASFQMFALTAVGNVLLGEGKLSGGGNVRGDIIIHSLRHKTLSDGEMSYPRVLPWFCLSVRGSVWQDGPTYFKQDISNLVSGY